MSVKPLFGAFIPLTFPTHSFSMLLQNDVYTNLLHYKRDWVHLPGINTIIYQVYPVFN